MPMDSDLAHVNAHQLRRKIKEFHEAEFSRLNAHQAIADIKSRYFQYSRFYAILKRIEGIKFASFVDVGCAEGMYLLAVQKLKSAIDTFGVDFSFNVLRKAKKFTSKIGSNLVCADASELPFRNECFDVVLCSETLEHVPDDKNAIKELARICKKLCIITVPVFWKCNSKLGFEPDYYCERDSHLRKYFRDELKQILVRYFSKVKISEISFWCFSSLDIFLDKYLPKEIAAKISKCLAALVGLDYRLCSFGAHGHSLMALCTKRS